MSNCRACGNSTEEVADLGQHYLSDFVGPGESRGGRWPLRLVLCTGCSLLQLGETVPRDILYHERYGFKSGVNENVRADLAGIASYATSLAGTYGRWLDIGSNDGTLLSFVSENWHRTGIDPLEHFAEECEQHADRVIADYFSPKYFSPGEFDVVTSSAMFYDLDNPLEFARQVAQVLAPRGTWVIQQNYALDMLRNNVIDNVCQEHLTYFSLKSLSALLENAGLEIISVTGSNAKGGCIRTAVRHKGICPAAPEYLLKKWMRQEEPYRIGDPETWRRWFSKVLLELDETRTELEAAAARGQRAYIYGAGTRGATFLQLIRASTQTFPFAVDRYPAKWGKVMTATGIPIVSEERMRADHPDYLLVAPWFFRDLFLEREKDYLLHGGRMIFPLPKFEVVML